MARKEMKVTTIKDEFDEVDFKILKDSVRDLTLRLARLEEQVATLDNGDYDYRETGDDY